MKSLTEVFDNVQGWLDSKNSRIHPNLLTYGGYLPFNERPGYMHPGQAELPHQYIPYPIQQVKQEIMDFTNALINNGKFENILEIGIGQFGGTHVIWRELFKNVVSIDNEQHIINDFLNTNEFVKDGKSHFVHGDSSKEATVDKLPFKEYDALFIDGHHSYNAAFNDYKNYSKLVRPGGIIGFHDACTRIHHNAMEVPLFLDELSKGGIDGKVHHIHYAKHSMEIGIGWIYV